MPYYDAVIATYKADPMGEFRLPNGVPGYRMPTLFALWQLLPAHGSALVPAFLLFATLAVGGGVHEHHGGTRCDPGWWHWRCLG